ncbi:unnamed protein product [Peniophora sp. CBMAI 1063]|nr:unnamed protein product [Peniophora sp. CBMAI 1063]
MQSNPSGTPYACFQPCRAHRSLRPIYLSKPKTIYTLGRDPANDIYLPGVKISYEHCIITWNGQENDDIVVSVRDTSSNGTWINGQRVEPTYTRVLRDGNEVAFATPLYQQHADEDYRYIFRILVGEAATVGLGAHYDLTHELGHGAFATVMKGVHRASGDWCAVKIIHRRARDDLSTLMREIDILKSLEHRNICALRECFFPRSDDCRDDNIYLVLELVDGGDLFQYIAEEHGLPELKAKDIAGQVCDAVAYIHSKGIVHRDLKPENILLSHDKTVAKVTDFGISRSLEGLSQTRTICGTPSYLAPELIDGDSGHSGSYDHLVDSWSLGVTVFCTLANCTPFIEDLSLPMAQRISRRQINWTLLGGRSDEVSEGARDFLQRLLDTNPVTRMSAADAIKHPWIAGGEAACSQDARNLAQPEPQPAMASLSVATRAKAGKRTPKRSGVNQKVPAVQRTLRPRQEPEIVSGPLRKTRAAAKPTSKVRTTHKTRGAATKTSQSQPAASTRITAVSSGDDWSARASSRGSELFPATKHTQSAFPYPVYLTRKEMSAHTYPYDALATWDEGIFKDPVTPLAQFPREDDWDLSTPADLYPAKELDIPEVIEINARIISLEREIQALRLRKAGLFMAHTPVKCLPPEILGRIFELAVHQDPCLLPDLSLVSTLWRRTTLSTPTLWTYIIYERTDAWSMESSAELHASFMRIMRTQLLRSGACKLYVQLDVWRIESLTLFQQILDELNPHLERVYFFSARVRSWEWMQRIADAGRSFGPALEQIHLDVYRGWEGGVPCIALERPCPALKYAVLDGLPPYVLGDAIQNVRVLHYAGDRLRRLDLDRLLATASAAIQLHTLRLQTPHFGLAEPSIRPLHVSHSLRTVVLHHLSSDEISAFVRAGRFPSLVHLGVKMHAATPGDADAAAATNPVTILWLLHVAEYSKEHLPALRLLDIGGVSFDGSARELLLQALWRLPQLTGLALSCPPQQRALGEGVLDMFGTRTGHGAWLLPRLEALAFWACSDITGHEVLQALRARATESSLSRIHYLKIAHCPEFASEVYAPLAQLADNVLIL